MGVSVRPGSLCAHRGWGPGAAALILVLFLSACAAPNQPTNQPANVPTTQSASHYSPSTVRNLQEASYYYNRYSILAPDDLLGLKRHAEVCTALEEGGVDDGGCREAALRVSGSGSRVEPETWDLRLETSPAVVLREMLEARTGDRRIVAQLLEVPVEDVQLGPNLVENGGFEEWVEGRPCWWVWSDMATGAPWNKGVFIGRADELDSLWGGVAARMEGFWLQMKPELEPGRVGFWQWDASRRNLREIEVVSEQPYLLSFHYRTERVSDRAVAMWLSRDQTVFFAGYRTLSPTCGEWRRFSMVGWSRAEFGQAIRPLVSLWSQGGVWFDGVVLREVTLNSEVVLTDVGSRFEVLEATLSDCP